MTYSSLHKTGAATLKMSGCLNADFDSFCLLELCTGLSRTQLVMQGYKTVNDETIKKFETLIGRRISGEPLQYIIGQWCFMGFEFYVGSGVLIPRQETEILVEIAMEKLKSRDETIVFDLCAGTGCIGISIAQLCKNTKVYLIEKSPLAMNYLIKNILKYNLNNIKVISGDICKGFNTFGLPKPDIILSNPPYIPNSMISQLQKEVMHEPSLALDGGKDGLEFYDVLIEKWFKSINTGGFMAVECGDGQSGRIENKFSNVSNHVITVNDLNNIGRVVIAEK